MFIPQKKQFSVLWQVGNMQQKFLYIFIFFLNKINKI